MADQQARGESGPAPSPGGTDDVGHQRRESPPGGQAGARGGRRRGGRGTGPPGSNAPPAGRRTSSPDASTQSQTGPDSEGRRRRSNPGRQAYAFGDEVERSFCDQAQPGFAVTFPVTTRTDSATRRVGVVDQRPGGILYCDGAHPGPHRWPSGDDVVATPPLEDGGAPEDSGREDAAGQGADVPGPES